MKNIKIIVRKGDIEDQDYSSLSNILSIKTATNGLYEKSTKLKHITIYDDYNSYLYIIEICEDKELINLKKLLENPFKKKILHDSNFHLTMIIRNIKNDIILRNCECIKIASLMLGDLYCNLANCVYKYLNFHLPSNKEEKGFKDYYDLTDNNYLTYLRNETFILTSLYNEIIKKITSKDLLKPYIQICEYLPFFLNESKDDLKRQFIQKYIKPEQQFLLCNNH